MRAHLSSCSHNSGFGDSRSCKHSDVPRLLLRTESPILCRIHPPSNLRAPRPRAQLAPEHPGAMPPSHVRLRNRVRCPRSHRCRRATDICSGQTGTASTFMESRREHLIATSEKMKPIHAGQPLLEWRGYTKDHNPQLKKNFYPATGLICAWSTAPSGAIESTIQATSSHVPQT